jgi:dolichyl-phosphate-mannose-protein mannosyltransferase
VVAGDQNAATAWFLTQLGIVLYRDDMTIFYGWCASIAMLPPGQVYAQTPGLNYPPAFVLIYEASAMVLHSFVHGVPSQHVLNIVLKLPAIAFDIVGAGLAYAIVRRHAGHLAALGAAAYIAFNPAVIYDSAYWGQNDSIPTVVALFALFALSRDKIIIAWVALAIAVLIKPPVLVLLPLLVLYPIGMGSARRRQRLVHTALGAAMALALADALAIMFFAHPTPLAAFHHLVGQLYYGSMYYQMNSLNAFNAWAILGPFFVPDSTRLAFLSMHAWGSLCFVVTALVIYVRYARIGRATAAFEASTLLLLAFFLFLTEMHERYLYYAVIFVGTLIFKRPYRYAALILSLTLLLNLEYGLTFMYLDDAHATMVDRFEFAPWLVHLCAVTNLGVFVWLLARFLGFAPASIARVRIAVLRALGGPAAPGAEHALPPS